MSDLLSEPQKLTIDFSYYYAKINIDEQQGLIEGGIPPLDELTIKLHKICSINLLSGTALGFR